MANRTATTTLRADVGQYVSQMERSARSTDEVTAASRRLQRDVSALEAQQRKAAKSIEDIAKAETAANRKRGEAMSRVGRTALVFGGAVAVGAGLAVKGFMDFDREMSAVGAAAQVSGKDLAALRDAALQAGKDTSFSATEAAKAEEALAKAGVSTSDILHGALAGALHLAAAGNLDLGDAAEYAASAMTTFNLSGRDVGHIADVLAAAAGKAQGDVSDMGVALQQSGLVAAQLGVSLDDTVGALAEFASNGLLGSDAGTSFKQMLLSLNPQSQQAAQLMQRLGLRFFDASGQFIGVSRLAGELRDKLGGLTQEQQNLALRTIFGSDAIRAANILMRDGADGAQRWARAVNDAGFAERVASELTDNLAGDLERLKGSIETALIEDGSAANGVLRATAQHIDGVVSGFSELPKPVQVTAAAFVGLTGAVAGTLGVIGTAAPKIAAGREALRNFGTAGATIDKGIGRFGRALGASIPVLGAAGVALDLYAQHKAKAKQAVDDFVTALQADNNVIGTNTRALAAQKLEEAGALETAQKYGIALGDVTDAALGNAAAQKRVNDEIDNAYVALVNATPANERAETAFKDQANALFGLRHELSGTNKDLNKAIDSAKRQAEAQRDAASSADKHARSTQDVIGALANERSEIEMLSQSLDELNGKNIGAAEGSIRFRDDVDQLRQSLRENGRTMDLNSAKGRANLSAFLDAAKSAQTYAEAIVNQTGDQTRANRVLADARTQLVNVMVQSGLTRAEAKKLVDQYLKIPPKRTTDINAADHATGVITRITRELNALDGRTVTTRVVTVDVNGTQGRRPRRPGEVVMQAAGGLVTGPGTSTSDSIPAMLSNGEYVVKAATVDKYGVGFLDRLNAGQVDVFGRGGYVRHSEAAPAQRIVAPAPAVTAPVNVYAPPGMPLDVLAYKVSRILGGGQS